MRVYLAGTISKEAGHLGWRGSLRERLRADGHVPVDPLRAQNPEHFSEDGLRDASTPGSFFVASDMYDLTTADAVFIVYWKGECAAAHAGPCGQAHHRYRRQSLGTWSEFGVAAYLHKPIIVVTDDPDVAGHPFVLKYAAIVVATVNEGYDWLRRLYL